MEFSWLNVLKYLGLVLTAGIAFVGTWMVDFTSKNEATGRKSLTKWGRIGFPMAIAALVCSVAISVWTDIDAALKRRRAEEQASIERAAATQQATQDRAALNEARQSAARAAEDITKVLETIRTTKLTTDEKTTIQETVKSLSGIEDYKTHFPELYSRMMRASSFEELRSSVNEALEASINSRISTRSECSVVGRPERGMPKGYPGGHFMFGRDTSIRYMITPEHVEYEFTDPLATGVGASGFSLVFDDGSESVALRCKRPGSLISCSAATSDPNGRKVYEAMQNKTIASVKSADKRYVIPPETAGKMRTTFACIAP